MAIRSMRSNDLGTYLGKDYHVNEKITIHQPTIGEIIEYGEAEYFSLIGRLTAYPGDMKSELWDIGIDYENISDFDMFVFMSRTIPQEESYILFGDLDLSKMEITISDIEKPMLFNKELDICIDENIHRYIFDFLVKCHGLQKDHEYAGTAETKQVLIDLDRQDKAMAVGKPYKSRLSLLISAMVNSAGFKYNYETVQNITLYQLMDSVTRIQIITSSLALLQGSYSGMIDTSKMNKEYFNWLREIKSDK